MKSPSILIATDLRAEAQTVQDVLHQEFARIAVSFNPASAAADFAACQPDVLVLAFSSLALAEQHYAGLYQGCQAIHAQPHRSIVLCEQHELQQTYQRCREGRFDDYVLFWPMVHDAPRLTMAVVHALRDLARTAEAEPAAGMAREVHQIADAQRVLESHTAQGLLQAEAAAKFLTGALAELERGQTQEAGKRLLAARSEVQSFGQWVLGLQRQLEPYGHCARALGELAGRFRPMVLIVDDNELERKLVGKVLEDELCELVFARSGTDALALLRKLHPDLILLDVDMPGMDGLQTLGHLKHSPQLAGIPVVMVTGHSEKEMVVRCLQAGAAAFAVKPLERANLLGKVRRYLQADGAPKANHA